MIETISGRKGVNKKIGKTIVEKIVAKAAGKTEGFPGIMVIALPSRPLTAP